MRSTGVLESNRGREKGRCQAAWRRRTHPPNLFPQHQVLMVQHPLVLGRRKTRCWVYHLPACATAFFPDVLHICSSHGAASDDFEGRGWFTASSVLDVPGHHLSEGQVTMGWKTLPVLIWVALSCAHAHTYTSPNTGSPGCRLTLGTALCRTTPLFLVRGSWECSR